jgi:hypothetical protein
MKVKHLTHTIFKKKKKSKALEENMGVKLYDQRLPSRSKITPKAQAKQGNKQ